MNIYDMIDDRYISILKAPSNICDIFSHLFEKSRKGFNFQSVTSLDNWKHDDTNKQGLKSEYNTFISIPNGFIYSFILLILFSWGKIKEFIAPFQISIKIALIYFRKFHFLRVGEFDVYG